MLRECCEERKLRVKSVIVHAAASQTAQGPILTSR